MTPPPRPPAFQEENWAIELTALGIRNKTLEAENAQLRDDGQRYVCVRV